MEPQPGAQAAAAGLRAARADRERVIDLLKAAFVQDRLDRDELDVRVGQALTARTYAELATVTADLPAELIGAPPRKPPVRERRRIPMGTAINWGACMFVVANLGVTAAVASGNPMAVAVVALSMLAGLILAIGAIIVAS